MVWCGCHALISQEGKIAAGCGGSLKLFSMVTVRDIFKLGQLQQRRYGTGYIGWQWEEF
jgi:hypothetical protein